MFGGDEHDMCHSIQNQYLQCNFSRKEFGFKIRLFHLVTRIINKHAVLPEFVFQYYFQTFHIMSSFYDFI